MKSLQTFDIKSWDENISREIQEKAIQALESGLVLFFPKLPFQLEQNELKFLSPHHVDPKTKNISYDYRTDRMAGTLLSDSESFPMKEMIRRYASISRKFIDQLLPHYQSTIIQAKTSFRPVEIKGRKSSYRKDDTLLHVDSFPSNPTKGTRILRIFTNINQAGLPRVWRLGEPFKDVVQKMGAKLSHPLPFVGNFFKWLKITKDYRTMYDHYMLQLHDHMKGDPDYQSTVPQEEIHFPAGSTWIVFTDQVSHAAMSGQHVLEQTFNLPIQGIKKAETAPLHVLEKYFNKQLVSR